ncbi:uncharacterized protein LOC132797508 [Drosophila nasuta]|uniref:uncharacterized protein LOC132797508 n=1 Tax=Drosophila nasuta TaxID=42062 RepID=UPI00295EDF39|nr:uncharacterized protein LOC132797508 [Drosophila nasuta]
MHHIISKIWLTESMPEDWNLSMICPILKKGDATVHGLLPVAYKVLTSCGFRPGKSTVDQIFTLRQILEKSYENQIDTYHLFVDYKAAFDSPRRDRLYAAMSELGIPAKLTRLCRMTLSNTISSFKYSYMVRSALGVFERKVLRKIFGPICVDDVYRIRYNHELYELYGDVDVASRVKSQRLRWLGHVARMDEDAPARKVFAAVIVGTRRRGRPRTRWQDQVMETLSR